jgi:hypothetical protein
LKKHRTRKNCTHLAARFLKAIHQLRQTGLAHWCSIDETLSSWSTEIATMWRFTRNNGITEGFHTKMEMLQRQAYVSVISTTIARGLRLRVHELGQGRDLPP